jgi:hypothetical protein
LSLRLLLPRQGLQKVGFVAANRHYLASRENIGILRVIVKYENRW